MSSILPGTKSLHLFVIIFERFLLAPPLGGFERILEAKDSKLAQANDDFGSLMTDLRRRARREAQWARAPLGIHLIIWAPELNKSDNALQARSSGDMEELRLEDEA